jgi:nitric oxide reductase NorE protein
MQADVHTAGRPARLPGDSGIWTFIFADMCAFALFFLIFSVGRASSPVLYEKSRLHLNIGLGLLNTLILITSSYFVVRAVAAARQGIRPAVMRNLVLAIVIGVGFAVTKLIEYSAKLSAGIGLTTNEFFTYYFAFTGIHFLHFVIGVGTLVMMLVKSRTDVLDDKFQTWIESVGCYWHMVDLLWIMLFPMLYLLRAA